MKRETEVTSKTVRYDKELIEKILELVETKFEGWRKPDFSDLSRYGLRIVLAAYGIDYKIPSLHDVDYHSARRSMAIDELDTLIEELYIDSYERRDNDREESLVED